MQHIYVIEGKRSEIERILYNAKDKLLINDFELRDDLKRDIEME